MFEDWLLDLFQIITSIAVAIALVFTGATFFWARKADQIKIAEGVFNDLREMQKELSHHDDDFDYVDWSGRFFNTLEWFCLLVNSNTIKDKAIKEFFKDAVIDWCHRLLPNEDREDVKKYPELKKLYSEYTGQKDIPISKDSE